MYNRYIPQADGSYSRHSVPDRAQNSRPVPPKQPEKSEACFSPPPCERKKSRKETQPLGGFLQRLLPGGFDTEDLIVILLLLLTAGDCREDQNFALLTLGLYLFM